MQLTKSSIFSKKEESLPKKLSAPIILSLIGKIDCKGLVILSDDSVLVEQESNNYKHYLNGEFNTNCNIFSGFDMDVLNEDRVLINVVNSKEAFKIYNEYYDLTDTEESMQDYLEIEKVLNVITVNTKINLPDNDFSTALSMAKAYRRITRGSCRTLLTNEENISDAVLSVLNNVEDNSLENVYVYRNGSLVALAVSEFGDKVVLSSVRIIDL